MYRKIATILLFILEGFPSIAQNNISGKIITSDGQPAAMVNIELKGFNKNSISDGDGKFLITNIADGKYELLISYVGLQTQQKTITLSNNETIETNFSLKENAQQLEDVIIFSKKGINAQTISIGKIAINPMDIPQSIAVIGQTIIREQQSQRLSDIVKNVTGVYLADTRGGSRESFYARGYNLSNGNMFKNGSRVNSSIVPEVSSLEKVEVLKGSAAILYGNVAPGGIVNMVTKQPKFNFGGEVSLRAGSYGLIKPAFDMYGPMSDKIAYRVIGVYEKADSYRDVVQSERFYINPSLLFKLSKKTEFLLQGDYLNNNITPDFGIGTTNNTFIPDVPISRYMGTTWQYNKDNQTTITATIKHTLNSNWKINASGSYQLYNRDYYATERITADSLGEWNRTLNKIQLQEKYFIIQADLTGKFNTGKLEHAFIAGLDADNYTTTNYSFNQPAIYDKINILDLSKYIQRTDIPAASKITKVETPINRAGIFVQDLVTLSQKFNLLLGMRWSQQISNPATTTYLLKDSTIKGMEKHNSAFSPRIGFVYKPTKTISAFASYANSFSINNGTDVYGAALDPSLIDQFEIGIKNDLLKGKLSLNVTLYKIINNNLAQTAPNAADGITPNTNTSLKELTGQTTSDGIEIDISSYPAKGLNILAGYSHNNMRYTNIETAKGNNIEGERLVNTPAHTANGNVFYTFQKGKAKDIRLGVTVFYTGDRLGGYNNTQQQTQQYSRLIPVEGYTTVDISAGYNLKQFSMLVKVSNLFNAHNFNVHDNYSINPIAPTQLIGTVAYRIK